MAEESFEVRVKRLFGSNLFASVPSSGFPSTSWSVASGEVERQGWSRERGAAPDREADPCASAFDDEDGCFAKRARRSRVRKEDFQGDVDDLEDEGGEGKGEESGVEGEREAEEIRSSIGLDPTLDYEEEEDEYDRAAFHKENAGERVYMREINNHGPFMNSHTVLGDLVDDSIEEIHQHHRDPRADHFAASVRLQEDQKAADSCPPLPTDSVGQPAVDLRSKMPEFDANLKPILKRKKDQVDSKPKKRVRFDADCKDVRDKVLEESQDFHMVPQSMETMRVTDEDQSLPEESPGVPDYIRNPSKYICYTFDSLDNDDDVINRQAFEDFRNLVRRSGPEQFLHGTSMDLPKSVTFTPRKKASDPMVMDDKLDAAQEGMFMEPGQMLSQSTGIAAGEADGSEACEMEEDVTDAALAEDTKVSSRKQVRQYRSKSSADNAA